MKILIRNELEKSWQFASAITAQAEAELQALLVESPSIIPVGEIRDGISPLVFAVPEFGLPGSGKTDVLAFSPDGDISIIECKLAANAEVKRKVIGQILEYAAYLWGMDYEEVDGRVQTRRGATLSELVNQAVAGEWDEESFCNGAKSTLESGEFILIIVVDEIDEELRRIIRYLNDCSRSAFSLHALEMRRFNADGIEILVPHLYGVSSKPSEGGSGQKRWTPDRFFRVLAENVDPYVASTVRKLYEWTETTADRIWFGHGAQVGSFTFHYLKEGQTISVFSIYTDGTLRLNYGWLSKPLGQDTMERFHAKLTSMPAFSHIPPDFSKWPPVDTAGAFQSWEDTDGFRQTIEWLRTQLASSPQLV